MVDAFNLPFRYQPLPPALFPRRPFSAGHHQGRIFRPGTPAIVGFCVPFNASITDLEDEALAANHTLLAVDETRAADGGGDEREIAKVLVGTVMRWELGFEKGRKIAPGPRRSTSVPFLLTSNKGLGELGALAVIGIDDAHHGRLIGVPLPGSGRSVFAAR